MALSPQSVIVVGGGIVGLTVAVAAQSAGHKVTVVARDMPGPTSSIAAGMIAPALEAIGDADPAESFRRLKTAQQAWLDLVELWPAPLVRRLRAAQAGPASRYLFAPAETAVTLARLTAAGASFTPLADYNGLAQVRIDGDWLVESAAVLDDLRHGLKAGGGTVRIATANAVSANAVGLDDGRRIAADHVILAAGFASAQLAAQVPSLVVLAPVKGQLLDMEVAGEPPAEGVLRSQAGYWARIGGRARFGASMQAGRADFDEDIEVTRDLTARLRVLAPGLIAHPIARMGVRAASPDGWPMIGRDAASGILVATAMRRNGFVFAALAARMMLAFIAGETPSPLALYDPDRFS